MFFNNNPEPENVYSYSILYLLSSIHTLLLSLRDIFPGGLPEQFSFIVTWRTRKPPKTPWHIVQMTNIQNSTQFAITLNPKTEAVEFSILDYEGKLQTLSFKNAEVRDETIECKNASVVCFFLPPFSGFVHATYHLLFGFTDSL
jgi:hypothetical protein